VRGKGFWYRAQPREGYISQPHCSKMTTGAAVQRLPDTTDTRTPTPMPNSPSRPYHSNGSAWYPNSVTLAVWNDLECRRRKPCTALAINSDVDQLK